MTIENQTGPGVAASVGVGSLLAGSTANSGNAVGAPIGKVWQRKNAFGVVRRFKIELVISALWVAGAVGLIHLTEIGGPGWGVWIGCVMLALGTLILFSLPIQYLKVANAGLLTRVYTPFSRRWLQAAKAYEGKIGLVHFFYAVVYTICLPFLLLKDIGRVLVFIGRKLKGDNVKLGNREAVYNKRLGEALSRAVKELGPEKADYMHYVAWSVIEVPPSAREQVTFDSWQSGVREEVVTAKTRAFGPVLR